VVLVAVVNADYATVAEFVGLARAKSHRLLRLLALARKDGWGRQGGVGPVFVLQEWPILLG